MFTYHLWDSVEFASISKDEFVKWVQKVQIWNTSTSLRGQWDNMGLLIPGLSVVKCNTGRVNYNTEVLIIELNQIILFYHKTLLIPGNSPAIGEFPAQSPVTRSFDVFYDLRQSKRLSKQWWDWWFETPSRSLWRNCNVPLNSPLSSNKQYIRNTWW